MKKYILFSLLSLSVIFSGCMSPRINGGKISHTSPTGITSQTQSDDPKGTSSTDTASVITKELIIPAGSLVEVESPDSKTKTKITTSSNTIYSVKIEDKSQTSLGGAQKNVIGETIAKLGQLKWVSYLGAAMFIFGLVSMFYPPLRAIISSYTTSMVIAAGGLLLIILPTLIVGNELLIFGVVVGVAIFYFFVYRYGGLSKENKILREFSDLDSDGVDDEVEQIVQYIGVANSKEQVDRLVKSGNGLEDKDNLIGKAAKFRLDQLKTKI